MAKRKGKPKKGHSTKVQPAKGSNAFWWIIGAVVLVVVIGFVMSQTSDTGVEYANYQYVDSDVVKENASVIIEEFSDFQCPFCQNMAPVLRQVKQDFDVRVEYKHFPLASIHPFAQRAAEASECARDQSRFWAYHDVLMDSKLLSPSDLDKHAEGLGLDMETFKSCVDDRVKQIVVEEDRLEGTQRGVTGTPTIFVDGERVQVASYADFARILAE